MIRRPLQGQKEQVLWLFGRIASFRLECGLKGLSCPAWSEAHASVALCLAPSAARPNYLPGNSAPRTPYKRRTSRPLLPTPFYPTSVPPALVDTMSTHNPNKRPLTHDQIEDFRPRRVVTHTTGLHEPVKLETPLDAGVLQAALQ